MQINSFLSQDSAQFLNTLQSVAFRNTSVGVSAYNPQEHFSEKFARMLRDEEAAQTCLISHGIGLTPCSEQLPITKRPVLLTHS